MANCGRSLRGHAGLLVPGLLTAAAGMTILIWLAVPAALIAGMCLFVVYTGNQAAFALIGTLMLAALVPAVRDRAADGR